MENYLEQNTQDDRMSPLLSLKDVFCMIVVGSLVLGGLYTSVILAIRFLQS